MFTPPFFVINNHNVIIGIHNLVKQLHDKIISLEFSISSNTKPVFLYNAINYKICRPGITGSLVLAKEIKSIIFNIHFWKKGRKEQSKDHRLRWQIISNITACESYWYVPTTLRLRNTLPLLRWAKRNAEVSSALLKKIKSKNSMQTSFPTFLRLDKHSFKKINLVQLFDTRSQSKFYHIH